MHTLFFILRHCLNIIALIIRNVICWSIIILLNNVKALGIHRTSFAQNGCAAACLTRTNILAPLILFCFGRTYLLNDVMPWVYANYQCTSQSCLGEIYSNSVYPTALTCCGPIWIQFDSLYDLHIVNNFKWSFYSIKFLLRPHRCINNYGGTVNFITCETINVKINGLWSIWCANGH